MWRSRFKNKNLIIFLPFLLGIPGQGFDCVLLLYPLVRCTKGSCRDHKSSMWCVCLCDVGSGREENGPALASSDRVGGCVLGAGGGGDAIMYRACSTPYHMQSGLNPSVLKIRATNRIPRE
jgi:hypothetical protein